MCAVVICAAVLNSIQSTRFQGCFNCEIALIILVSGYAADATNQVFIFLIVCFMELSQDLTWQLIELSQDLT